MVLYGRIIEVDIKTGSGIIQDERGREYVFLADECGGILPPKYTTVTFIRDRDFKTPVASLIRIDQLPPRPYKAEEY